ncbi:MAG: dTDP-4-dehydrorhamnose reductase [Oscillospiraceae bacterium]|nr:dTDP-4-dehydrorhamnose reductase [Oscillospiraceae bacterium]
MKILVTGVNGQLGHDVLNEVIRRGHTGIGSGSRPEYQGVPDGSAAVSADYIGMDITREEQVLEKLMALRPEAVIHCAAWTDVDGAEEEANIPRVFAVNEGGTRNLARACADVGCRMMYISTDYVFDGQGSEAWKPDCRDFHPLNVYGRSKLAGELALAETLEQHFIVRIAWVFGLNGKNFVKTMLQIGKTHDTLRVVNDQIGTPTYTRDLARLLADLIESEKYGIYHATNEGGYISWYDFACAIFRQAGMDTTVLPVTTAEYGLSRARRPFNSRLDKSKLAENGFLPLPDWQDALARYLKEIDSSLWTRKN